jgi:YbbR domain-containing protein
MFTKKKKIKKHSLKVLSVFFSFILWIYVVSSENVVFEKTVLVKYITPKSYTISTQAPSEVVFTLKGPRAFLRDYLSNDNDIIVDLSNLRPQRKNQYVVNFKNLNINLPFGIQLVNANPVRKVVKIEPEVKKLIGIEPVLTGEVDKDLRLTSHRLSRKKVLISGPSSLLRSIKKINTKPIMLEKLKKDGKLKIELNLPDNRLSAVDKDPIFWEYNVRANKANKRVSNVPIIFVSSKFIKRSSLKKASVIVLTEEDVDVKEMVSQIKIMANVPNDAKGKVKVKLSAQLPENIMLLEIIPPSIEVYVK